MITDSDIKALRRYKTRSGKIANWIIVIAPIFLFVVGILNLHLASKIGSNEGYSLWALFQSWIEGINVNKQYSGLYLKAMERLETALLQFGLSLILSIMAYDYHKMRKMNARILETLKHTGVLKET